MGRIGKELLADDPFQLQLLHITADLRGHLVHSLNNNIQLLILITLHEDLGVALIHLPKLSGDFI